MKRRKTIALYLLCFAAMVPVFLSAAFLGGRLLIRIVMIKSLESENVITLKLEPSQIRWYKKNHELIIDGKMFDVKSMAQQNGYLVVTGLFDDMETEMNALLEKNHDPGSRDSKSTHSIYQVCLGIIGIKAQNPGSISALNNIQPSYQIPADQFQLYDTDIIPTSPPPEC